MGTGRARTNRTVDVRAIILSELDRRKMSRYDLVKRAKEYGIGEASVYDFLAARSPINSDYLGHLLVVLDLTIAPNTRSKKP